MFNHPTYGLAARVIASDAGPCHASPANPVVTDANEPAAACNSSANPSQADAAASIGPRPAPANMRAEFTSGGKTAKFIAVYFLGWPLSVGHHRGGYPP
ncbi:Uncharacterised protein [Mycobacterium tuberculosis]|nr:Uncharacterised protein [Mycobacterium tuberculosis]